MKYFAIAYLTLAGALTASAQMHQISIGVIPNIVAKPLVDNPTPADIAGRYRVNGGAEIIYTHNPKARVGFLTGISAGIWNWNVHLQAPRQAFGTHQGNGNVDFTMYAMNFIYTGLMVGIISNQKLGNVDLHLEGGANLRLYPFETEPDGIGATFNRNVNYDENDPNGGPPDLEIEIPPAARTVHPNIFLTALLPLKAFAQSTLFVGLTGNMNVFPVGKGTMIVQYNDVLYSGNFSPRSSYLGINLRYGINIRTKN